MPIYEYECTQCGQVEEALQNFSDPPLNICRNCSGTLHKLISQSSFHLKGSGWYVTDYANSSRNSSGTSEKKEASSSADDAKGAKTSAETS